MLTKEEIQVLKDLYYCKDLGKVITDTLFKAITYFDKPLIEKILDMLDLKVGEEFITTYDNKTYRLNKFLVLEYFSVKSEKWIASMELTIEPLINGTVKIIKLPPQPLLTEDEKKFLSYFPNTKYVRITNSTYNRCTLEIVSNKGSVAETYLEVELNLKFEGLEFNKEYTKEELNL